MKEKINEIVKLCAKNNFEFILTKEGDKNKFNIIVEEKKFILNIPDFEDKNLISTLNKKIEELKNLSK